MPKNCHFSTCLRTKNCLDVAGRLATSLDERRTFFLLAFIWNSIARGCLSVCSVTLSRFSLSEIPIVAWNPMTFIDDVSKVWRIIISSDGKFDNHAIALFKSVNIRNTHAGGALVRYTFENVVCDDRFSRRNRCVLGEFCPKRCAECGYRLSVIVSTTRKNVDSKETRNRARKRPGRSRRQITGEKSER